MKIKTSLYSLLETLLDAIEEEFPEWETWEQDKFAWELLSDLAFTGRLKFASIRVENYPRFRPISSERLASSG